VTMLNHDAKRHGDLASPAVSTVEHVELMGVQLAKLTEAQTTDLVLAALDDGRGGWICPVNLDVLRQIVHQEALRTLVSSADLVVADGMPLLWAARIQGTPLPGRVAGSSLISTLSAQLARRHRSIYLLGGNEGTAQAAGMHLQATMPGLRLAGSCCPPFGFEHSPEQLERIMAGLESSAPDVVFVGLGFPKQDRLIAQLRTLLPRTWFVSCGISFSFLVGEVRRAPPALQALGLEWTHRLAQEPSRLARRYLVDGLPFAARLGTVSVRRRLASHSTGSSDR
jgi:N-acetylglucosaminyldiphosphoundecaprenol N-acetyl-beta-D-mannosaminyltransferase